MFSHDLLVDPKTREVSDVKHKIVAVGSRSKESAEKFVEAVWKKAEITEGKEDVATHGSYEDLVADQVRWSFLPPSPDCTDCSIPSERRCHLHRNSPLPPLRQRPPRSFRRQERYVAPFLLPSHPCILTHPSFAVLCEKALTVNAAQAQALVDLARAKGLFFMEAVRFSSSLLFSKSQLTLFLCRSGLASSRTRTRSRKSSAPASSATFVVSPYVRPSPLPSLHPFRTHLRAS